MTTVTVYHNLTTDYLRGYREAQPLVRVFEYETGEPASPMLLLDRAFEAFNVGDDPAFGAAPDVRALALRYRARRLRSLSVGDVLAVDGVAYSCDSAGWSPAGPLTVLEGAAAEAEIRARYQMRPTERLTVTVPLPAENERTGHTCEHGPLCAEMARYLDAMDADADRYDDPMSRAYGYYPELEPTDPGADQCQHWTCLGIVHGQCDACQADGWADYYREGA